MSIYRTRKVALWSTQKLLVSTFRISYYPHFYHRVLSLKIPCANNQALSSNNLGLLREKGWLLREKAGLLFIHFGEKSCENVWYSQIFFVSLHCIKNTM